MLPQQLPNLKKRRTNMAFQSFRKQKHNIDVSRNNTDEVTSQDVTTTSVIDTAAENSVASQINDFFIQIDEDGDDLDNQVGGRFGNKLLFLKQGLERLDEHRSQILKNLRKIDLKFADIEKQLLQLMKGHHVLEKQILKLSKQTYD